MKEIKELRSHCSMDADNIPIEFTKLVATELASTLTHMMNTCIDTSTFPFLWKISSISSISKVDRPTVEKYYRPISILPTLSRVFEKLVMKQLITFIEEASLFGPCMSGFRNGHSTTTALLGARDYLKRSLNRGEVSLLVLADFSKAFDTVRLSTALRKMHCLGFSRILWKWMLSYLSDRRQFVQFDDKCSDMECVTFGVPQGSILGSLIFNLYVVDLKGSVECKCFQYAVTPPYMFITGCAIFRQRLIIWTAVLLV